jgi:hypothetical protein
MKARHLYLLCCVLGLALSYSQFVRGIEARIACHAFVSSIIRYRISALFRMDVIVGAIVLIWFVKVSVNVCDSGLFGFRRLEHWSQV